VAAVIPALDEEDGIRALLAEWPRGLVDEVVVVDGGSSDGTWAAALAGGARVVIERRRGYGRACAAGAAATSADVLVFLDGDGSDDPAHVPAVLAPVLAGRAHLSLGARRPEPGAVLPHQALGNRLVALLIRAVHGVRVRDVPPMRAIRRDALAALGMREMTYGWPTEMIVKAARRGMAIAEVEVGFRARRAGASKVSGRLWPSLRAAALMLAVTLRGGAPRPLGGGEA
jgi:glycosyltransferase involved in cell wall biosynthesis